jgi:small-conductance mechanosensitive channel
MDAPVLQFVGNNHTVQIAGVRLLGINAENGRKLLFTVVFLIILYLLRKLLCTVAGKFGGDRQRVAFWTRQVVSLTLFVFGLVGLVSIWFDNPSRLATGAGLLGAGLAFALQKVVTSFACYFVI